MENVQAGSTEMFQRLTPAGRQFFLDRAGQLLTDDEAVRALYSIDYERVPPDIATFLTHADYVGGTGFVVFPGWVPVIERACRINSGITECILTGAQGRGKTAAAMLMLLYKLTRLTCMRDPARFYGLAPRTQIVFGLYMVTKRQLRNTGFYLLRDQLIDNMPYYKDVFPRVPFGKEQITWDRGEKRILVEPASKSFHALGLSLFAVAADELNYFEQGQSSSEDAHDVVEECSARLESRFLTDYGDIPGIAVFISQTRTEADFLEQRARDKRDSDRVLVDRGPRWERGTSDPYKRLTTVESQRAAPYLVDTMVGKVPGFRVYRGSETSDPRVLDTVNRRPDESWMVEPADPADSPDESRIIYVPVNHYSRFVDDLYGALRLQADCPSSTFTPFFSRRQIVEAAFHEELINPLDRQTVRCYEGQGTFRLSDTFAFQRVTNVFMGRRAPIRHPESPRYIHLDPAKGGEGRDWFGIAMVHPSGHHLEERKHTALNPYDDAQVGESLVMKDVECDFYLRLTAGPRNEPIDFRKVRLFLDWLRRTGFWIRKITADGWNTLDMLQRLREIGFTTEPLSVDRTSKPHKTVRQVMNEGRLAIPYPRGYTPERWGSPEEALRRCILFNEMIGLEHNVQNDKVDHRKRNPDGSQGSKDISDALIGAAFSCLLDDVSPGENPEHTKSSRMAVDERFNRFLIQGQVSKYLPGAS